MAGRRTRFVRPAPKTKMWIGAGAGTQVLAASGSTLIASLSAGQLALRPFTILRTRMDVLVASDQTGAAENPFGSYGMVVVTDKASGVGITAVPEPSGDLEADWFVHQHWSLRFEFVTGVGFHPSGGFHYEIDSRAMRKVGPDDDVVTVGTIDNAFGMRIVEGGRHLIQLH